MKKPYKVGSCCFTDLMCEISGHDSDPKEEYVDKIKETFEDNFNYRPVCLNFEYEKFYKTWIYEGNEKDKTVGYKYLQSYPYDTIKFKIGDFVHWDYFHVNGKNTKSRRNSPKWSIWLIQSLDNQELFDIKGRILLCNDNLRWTTKENIKISLPCVIEDSMKYTTWTYGTKGVIIEGAEIVALTQLNEDTKVIGVNDRFVFNKRTFKVVQKNDVVNTNLLELYLTKTSELPDDDLEDGYTEDEEINNDINGDVVLPDITSLSKGESQDYSIYNYINGEKQLDEFDIISNDVPNKYFTLNIIDGNNFVISNINRYSKNPLNINIKNKITNQVSNFYIWLNGV